MFRLETFFNPQSGNLSDAVKSLVQNNGRPLANQTTNVDSSVAGQLFSGAAYAGFSSKSFGTITFGRHVTPAGRRDRQVRPDVSLECLLADRLLGHHRRRR